MSGFEDCARLGMAEFFKRWLKLDIYGGQELCNNYKLHLVFALQDNTFPHP